MWHWIAEKVSGGQVLAAAATCRLEKFLVTGEAIICREFTMKRITSYLCTTAIIPCLAHYLSKMNLLIVRTTYSDSINNTKSQCFSRIYYIYFITLKIDNQNCHGPLCDYYMPLECITY